MNVKKVIFQLFFICFSTVLFAQYQVTIEAFVLNKNTNQPIPFGNIRFLNKEIKTIADKGGKFKLVYDEDSIKLNDVFQCSAFGFKTIEVKASKIFKLLKNTNKIYLVPNLYNFKKEPKENGKKKAIKPNGNISGIVTSNSKPVRAATISIKNSFKEVQTDAHGYFQINATIDDVLFVNYLGMLPKEILITNESGINIELEPDGELLDEVLLKGKTEKRNLINLGKGESKNFDAIGTSANVITAKDIKPNIYDMKDLLYGKFAGLNNMMINTMGPDPGLPRVMLRGGGSLNNGALAAYEIDGAFYSFENNATLPNISPQDIESITILKSLAATTKYGTLGRGGVIVIKTKINGYNKAEKNAKSAFATGNDYEENLTIINTSLKKPFFIKELDKSSSYKEALSIYKIQKKLNSQLSIPFFVDVSSYFKKWDKDYALSILSSIGDLAYDNPKALKTLAYNLELQGKLEEAKYIYQRIVILRPKAAQSYRDLALIYKETGYYKDAIELYGQMLNNKIENVDFSGLKEVITNELKHLLAKHRSKVNYSNVHPDYLKTDFKYDMRIVFEWNDANTEFEVQFVNPKKKFFKWSQTKFDNRDKMLDGITKGYHAEEFIIDDDERGEWIINIESLNEEPPLNPTYLKYTVYRNYGLANETKVIKVINLNDCNEKVTLDKLINR